jgi:pyruvate dehydrogenase complex dehydrogenase (E1) component
MAATVPNCRAYDPCFAGELAVILDHGMREMLEQQRDVFYYVTLMNENYPQPSLPAGVAEDIIRGLYRYTVCSPDASAGGASAGDTSAGGAFVGVRRVRLVGSGTILREVIAAAQLLSRDHGIEAEVWSATSFSELAREGPGGGASQPPEPRPAAAAEPPRTMRGGYPVVAATDYVRAWPQLIASHVEAPFTVLGTDGFGRSDTRAALREFFEVDARHVALAALDALRNPGPVQCRGMPTVHRTHGDRRGNERSVAALTVQDRRDPGQRRSADGKPPSAKADPRRALRRGAPRLSGSADASTTITTPASFTNRCPDALPLTPSCRSPPGTSTP